SWSPWSLPALPTRSAACGADRPSWIKRARTEQPSLRPRPPFLLGDGQLRCRLGLEPLVGHRLPAQGREAVGPPREALLGARDGRQPRTQVLGPARVELVLV